jgi:hypothetical protein
MAAKSDGGPPDSEAAAHRRWLVTIAITILFGTFGAVMTYLTYAKGSRSPGKASSSVPSGAPSAAPITAPATAPTEEPAGEPRTGDGDKDKPKGKDKDGKDGKDE